MEDYRDKMCVLDGKYIAKCVGQDFISERLKFEVPQSEITFVREGEYGVEIYEYYYRDLELEDVAHLLPTIILKRRDCE